MNLWNRFYLPPPPRDMTKQETPKPTKREMRVLVAYNKYIKHHGHPPTFELMGNKLSMTGPGVYYHIKSLRKKGLISELAVDIYDDANILERLETKLDKIICMLEGGPVYFEEDSDSPPYMSPKEYSKIEKETSGLNELSKGPKL